MAPDAGVRNQLEHTADQARGKLNYELKMSEAPNPHRRPEVATVHGINDPRFVR